MAYNQVNPQAGLLPPPPLLPPPAAAGGSGGGGGRRRRGGGNRPRRNAEVAVRPPRQTGVPAPTGPPRPTHLATTSTPERNDPLWVSGVAGSELQPMPNVEYVYSGAEALPQVVSVLHASCSVGSAGYARRVPESALGYYCGVVTYARMLQLQASNSLFVSVDEERFVEQVSSLSLSPPMLLAHYLAGFGNTRVPSGRDVRFRMPDRQYVASGTTCGWFGMVAPATQPLYQCYPCLGVYSARINADLSDDAFARTWDLPEAMRPVEGGSATGSLLGYGPRARLGRGQREFLESSGVYFNEAFPTVNPSLPLNIALLHSIQNELNSITTLKKSSVPTSIVGSQAQLAMIRFEDELAPVVSAVQLTCPYQLAPEISFSASAFAYRVSHSLDELQMDSTAPWVVWKWLEADRPGNYLDYAEAGNAYRLFEPDFLQIAEFRTTPYLLRSRLEALEKALSEHG